MKKIKVLTAAISAITASGLAVAQSGTTQRAGFEGGGVALEEIFVTAQRREQSLLDVPVAVSSLSAEKLKEYEIDDLTDVMNLNPSVSGNQVANAVTQTDVRIRGIGTTGSNAGFESSVGIYVDDIYYSRGGLALISFYDMSSVEIYRGPQGTLFGRNITAGAIAQKTAAPVIGESSGYVTAEIAEFDSYELEGAVNVPLTDTSALRVSAIYDVTDGFMENIVTDDDAAANYDVGALRVQYLTEPSEDLSIRLMFDKSEWQSDSLYQAGNSIANPDGTPFVTPGGQRPGRLDTTTSFPSSSTIEQIGFSAHVEYDINDTVALKSITSYRDVDSDNLDGDFDFSAADIAGDLDETQDMKSFSQEFLLTFDTENAFITTGIHYFDEEIDYQRFNVNLTGALGGGTFQNVAFLQDETSLGIFAHVDYTLNEQWSVIGGVRWSEVEKDLDFSNLLGTPQDVYDNIANDFFLSLFFGAGGGADTAFPYELSRTFDEVTGDIALQWRPTDAIQAYVKYSRGFKAGGFNMNEAAAGGRPLPGVDPADTATVAALGATDILGNGTLFQEFNPDASAFDSEIVDAYELSVRYQLERGLIAVTYFDSEISDLQVGIFTGLNFETLNAPEAESSGFEIEFNYNITNNLAVSAAATFLDTEITKERSRDELIRGREFIYAPDTAFVIGANYRTSLSDSLELSAAVNVSYHSDEYTRINGCLDGDGNSAVFDDCVKPASDNILTPNSLAFFQNESHYLANASVGLTVNQNLNAELFCTNCTDEEHTTFNTFTPIASVRSDFPGAPRIVGARVRYDF